MIQTEMHKTLHEAISNADETQNRFKESISIDLQ